MTQQKKKIKQSKKVLSSRRKKRDTLITATIDSINQYGLNNTTMETISQIAGVSRGTLNHHFDDKDDLLFNAMRHLIKEILHRIKVINSEDISPLEKLEKIIFTILCLEEHTDDDFSAWMSFWAESLSNSNLKRLLNIYNKRVMSNLKFLLKIEFDQETAKYISESLFYITHGVWIEMRTNETEDHNYYRQNVTRLFWEIINLNKLFKTRYTQF